MIATTTPQQIALLTRIRRAAAVVETGGATGENEHLSIVVRQWLTDTYGGTRQGRQELNGELLTDAEGTLWTRETIERARRDVPLDGLRRVVIGVDPPVSADGDACGIIVAGVAPDGEGGRGKLWVLDDRSVAGMRPEGWTRAVAQAADDWDADRIVAEKNQGGDMVESVLRAADARLPVTLVSASKGKVARAEPIALAFERGDAFLGGCFPALEDELAGFLVGGGYEPAGAAGRSPDRADAMVWALTELMRPRAMPRARSFWP